MWFTALGAVEVRASRSEEVPIDIGAPANRRLLAVLLTSPGRALSTTALVDALWQEEPPANAARTVQMYASRLRRAVGSDRIVRRGGGYALMADSTEVDHLTMADLVRRAGGTYASGEPEQALRLLEESLALWGGEPFAEFPDLEVVQAEARRLSELRSSALELRAELLLAQGAVAVLVPELTGLVTAHPYREGLRGLLMLALYRSGRQADALEQYRRARELFSEQLGVEPGEELRRLHERILRNDPSLQGPSSAEPSSTDTHTGAANDVPATRPAQLPPPLASFSGRQTELAQLAGSSARVIVVDGMAGVGKTALVCQAANACAGEFPDGQIFVDLHGFAEGVRPAGAAGVLGRMLRAAGVPGKRIPFGLEDRAALWRSELADRALLLVLDNAANEAQVRPLLPGAGRCRTLITSRRRLPGLDDALQLSLPTLPESDAIQLFARVAGLAPDDTSEPSSGSEAPEVIVVPEVIGIVRSCGHLPLAVRLAAARLRSRPGWTIADLERRMDDQEGRLDQFEAGERSVRTAFELSYEQLSPDRARLFRLLGPHPGTDFDDHAAASSVAMPLHDVQRALEDLVDQHLLDSPSHGRYTFHELLRSYAIDKARKEETDEDRRLARIRLFDYYLAAATSAMDVYAPAERHRWRRPADPVGPTPQIADRSEARAWLDTERSNLVAVSRQHAESPEHAANLGVCLLRYLANTMHQDEGQEIYRNAIAAARSMDSPWHETRALNHLGSSYNGTGRLDEAETYAREALRVALAAGDEHGAAMAATNLSDVLHLGGRYDDALRVANHAVESYLAASDETGAIRALNQVGVVLGTIGRLEQADAVTSRVLRLARESNDTEMVGRALRRRGVVLYAAGRYAEAFEHHREAVFRTPAPLWLASLAMAQAGDALREMGQLGVALGWHRAAADLAYRSGRRNVLPDALCGLGETLTASGRPDEALGYLQAALAVAEEDSMPRDQARSRLDLGLALRDLNQTDEAAGHLRTAYDIYRRLGLPRAADVRAILDEPDLQAVQGLEGATGTSDGGANSSGL